MDVDVLVVGAGAAGIAAARAVADSGLRVVLVEQNGKLGGLAESAMVGTICGLFFRDDGPPRYALHGFARTFSESLIQRYGCQIYSFSEGLHFLPYRVESFHRQGLAFLSEVDVSLLLYTSVRALTLEQQCITKVILQSGTRCFEINARAVVDCSGEAQVSRLAKQPLLTDSRPQAAAYVAMVGGLPELPFGTLAFTCLRAVKRAVNDGRLMADCERLSMVPGSVGNGEGLFKLGLSSSTRQCHGYRQAEIMARMLMREIVDFLRDNEPILKNLRIKMMAKQLGIRSAARPLGQVLLDEHAVLNCDKPDDGVAMGVWPIEYWGESKRVEMRFFASNDYYTIPAGALVSSRLDNLFFAGRSFSATEQAMASARVIGACLHTGYAAGLLAAAYVQTGNWRTGIARARREQIPQAEAPQ